MGASRIAAWSLLAILAALALAAAYLLRRMPPPLPLDGIGVKGVVRAKMDPWDESDELVSKPRIKDALIEVFDVESRELVGKTTTDAWGRYALAIPRAASCRVRASKPPDFERAERDVRVEAAVQLDFALSKRDASISGIVETVNDERVSGAHVTLEENPGVAAVTNSEGRFTLEHVARQDYRVRVEHGSVKGYVYYPVMGGRSDLTLVLPDVEDQDQVAHAESTDALIGRPAPALAARFTLPDGPPPETQGRVALLHFFASFNMASTRHVRELARAAAEHHFVFVPIHHAGAEAIGLGRFLEPLALGVPVLVDAPDAHDKLGSRTFARFGVSRLPTDIVLSSDGRVASVLPSKATAEEILSAVARAR
jgi:hypothetical protein